MRNILVALWSLSAVSSAFAYEGCRVVMTDNLNDHTAVLSVTDGKSANGGSAYVVVNNWGTKSPESEDISFNAEGKQVTAPGVPPLSKSLIVERYSQSTATLLRDRFLSEDGQLTWSIMDGGSCTEVELSLIQFLVFDWFYFG